MTNHFVWCPTEGSNRPGLIMSILEHTNKAE